MAFIPDNAIEVFRTLTSRGCAKTLSENTYEPCKGDRTQTKEMDSYLRRNEEKEAGLRGYKAEIRRCVAWNEEW